MTCFYLALFHLVIVLLMMWICYIVTECFAEYVTVCDECEVCQRDAASALTNPPRVLWLQMFGSNV